MSRDRGQLPHRHPQPADDLPIVEPAQCVALVLRGGAKAETSGGLVERAEEPGGAVGQRSIEVEDGKIVSGHGLDVRVGSDVLSKAIVRHGDARRQQTTDMIMAADRDRHILFGAMSRLTSIHAGPR